MTPPLGFSALVWGLLINTILYIVVSLCTKVPEEVVEKYITRVAKIMAGNTEVMEISGSAVAGALKADK